MGETVSRGATQRRLLLAATAIVAIALLERFVHCSGRSNLVLFLTGAADMGGLGFAADDAAEIFSRFKFATSLAPLVGGIVGLLLRPRLTLLLGLGAISAGQFWLPSQTTPHELNIALGLQAVGHGLVAVGILVGAGALFDDRGRRLALFFALYVAINTGGLLGPAAAARLVTASSYTGVFTVAGICAGCAALVALALCFVRTPARTDVGGLFRGTYGAVLFGGALIWFRVLAAAGMEWNLELRREAGVMEGLELLSGLAAGAAIAAAIVLAIAAGSGLLQRRPFSDNRLTAWGLALGALAMVLVILAGQGALARVPLWLGTSTLLTELAGVLTYAAVAVVASVSGPRLSSLFVGAYLAAMSVTTHAASSLDSGTELAWTLILITLLLAAVIGCWHWEEHAKPE